MLDASRLPDGRVTTNLEIVDTIVIILVRVSSFIAREGIPAGHGAAATCDLLVQVVDCDLRGEWVLPLRWIAPDDELSRCFSMEAMVMEKAGVEIPFGSRNGSVCSTSRFPSTGAVDELGSRRRAEVDLEVWQEMESEMCSAKNWWCLAC